MIWMLCTYMFSKNMGRTHYLKVMGEGGAFSETFVKYLQLMWQVSVGSLFSVRLDASVGVSKTVMLISRIVLGAGFVFGSVWGMVKEKVGSVGATGVFCALLYYSLSAFRAAAVLCDRVLDCNPDVCLRFAKCVVIYKSA